MLGPIRCSTQVKHLNYTALALSNTSLGQVISNLTCRLNYSTSKGCKDVAQTTGMKVEPWPKPEQPQQPWRCECPDQQPPNYDPYRIKVPEPVVPPLPPSNAKRTGVVYTTSDQEDPNYGQTGYRESPQQQQKPHGQSEDEESKEQGFFGRLKGFFEKLTGKGKSDEDAMIDDSQNITKNNPVAKSPPC